jgi:phosphatidylglycerophosphatase A
MPRLPVSVIRCVRQREPVSFWVATWFGCGLSPVGPGTVGTIGAIPLGLLLLPFGPLALLATALSLTIVGIVVSTRIARAAACTDPQFVVIDEVAGICLALAFAPATWQGVAAAFVLFRLFDVTKPPPCRWIERRLPPGPGIMLDDTIAALFAGVVLLFARWLEWL